MQIHQLSMTDDSPYVSAAALVETTYTVDIDQ